MSEHIDRCLKCERGVPRHVERLGNGTLWTYHYANNPTGEQVLKQMCVAPAPAADNRATAYDIARAWIHESHDAVDPVEWLVSRITAALDAKDAAAKASRSESE